MKCRPGRVDILLSGRNNVKPRKCKYILLEDTDVDPGEFITARVVCRNIYFPVNAFQLYKSTTYI